MHDPRLPQIAQVLVQYSLDVRPGEHIFIQSTTLGAPLAREVYRAVLRAGAYPYVRLRLPDEEEIFFKEAPEAILRTISPLRKWVTEHIDGFVDILAESNTKQLTNVDPKRIAIYQETNAPLLKTYMERAAKGELKWVVTLYPTEAFAQDAEMSLAEFTEFVFQACLPDPEDPVGYWQRVRDEQQKLVAWLSERDEIRVEGPGTDLRLRVKGRTWISADGKNNFPDGEVFTAPLEDSVEGRISFTYPAVYRGREVEGVTLWFEKGRVVKATAQKGEAFLHEMLETDEGARRVGEFAIGLNPGIQRFTRNILFDEKIKGTVHLALGRGYPECGSRNESAIHWDMICDLRKGGRLYADGRPFYENGEFTVTL